MSEEEVKKCKMDSKFENGKMKLKIRGYCDLQHPDKKTDRDIEIKLNMDDD